MRHFLSVILVVLVLSGGLFGIAGLRGRVSHQPPLEIFSDMNRQPKLAPAEAVRFYGQRHQFPIAAARHDSAPPADANRGRPGLFL